jgi:hypothetical protein
VSHGPVHVDVSERVERLERRLAAHDGARDAAEPE